MQSDNKTQHPLWLSRACGLCELELLKWLDNRSRGQGRFIEYEAHPACTNGTTITPALQVKSVLDVRTYQRLDHDLRKHIKNIFKDAGNGTDQETLNKGSPTVRVPTRRLPTG